MLFCLLDSKFTTNLLCIIKFECYIFGLFIKENKLFINFLEEVSGDEMKIRKNEVSESGLNENRGPESGMPEVFQVSLTG